MFFVTTLVKTIDWKGCEKSFISSLLAVIKCEIKTIGFERNTLVCRS